MYISSSIALIFPLAVAATLSPAPPGGSNPTAPAIDTPSYFTAGNKFLITWKADLTACGPKVDLVLLYGPSPASMEPLLYIAQGITNDGKYEYTPSTDLKPSAEPNRYALELVCTKDQSYQYTNRFTLDNPSYSGSASSSTTTSTSSGTQSVPSTSTSDSTSSTKTLTKTMTMNQPYGSVSSSIVLLAPIQNNSTTTASTTVRTEASSVGSTTTVPPTTTITTSASSSTSPASPRSSSSSSSSSSSANPQQTGAAAHIKSGAGGLLAAAAFGLLAL